MTRSRAEVLNISKPLSLNYIDIPERAHEGLWKCRISYDEQITDIRFDKYLPINSTEFKLVEGDIDYPHKYEDRSQIKEFFNQRGSADDIIIVIDGQISDSSYGNLIFEQNDLWFTPEKPLLPGTMRASLLAKGKIKTAKIGLEDLKNYSRFMMINALNPFDLTRALPMNRIIV